MEKSPYNPNYPQMPPQMTSANADQATGSMPPAPPSYDQATGSNVPVAAYPPVQVLPTPQVQVGGSSGTTTTTTTYTVQQQQPMPQATHRHNPPVAANSHTTYYAASLGGGAPPQMYQQQLPNQHQQQPVVIIQQAVLPLGPEPTFVTCPSCHIQKLTRIDYEPSSRTHLMAALLCILGLWCCVCLPYCAGSCMNTNHYCGNCNKFLGTYGNGL